MASAKAAEKKSPVELLWDILGSYWLACTLLGFLFLLTYLGTLEETEHGLFEVQKKYFESLFLVHDLGGFLPIPLPGVYLVLILLAANLLVGGIICMRKNSSTVGVLVIHLGIAVMLAAGLVKLKLSDDGHLMLFEGQVSDEYTSYFDWEVAVWDASQTQDVKEWIVPGTDFADLEGEASRTFTAPDLPLKLVFSHFEKNGNALPKGPMWKADNPVIDGYSLKREPLEKEAEHNVAGIYVHATDAQGGNARDGILYGLERYPFTCAAGGKTWAIDLRHKRYKMPFSIRLAKFTHELHPRTPIAKVYMSDVVKEEHGVQQSVKIQMNEPLRAEGLVLFQAGWGPEGAPAGTPLYSDFAVVRNPSDQWPLISCVIIGLGMVLTFGQKLARYMQAQAAERSSA
jgi:hypothetical protein